MIIALDIGTSSARAAAYDDGGRPLPGRFHRVRYRPRVTPDGGVEYEPQHLFDAVVACLDAVQAGGRPPEVEGVGVATFWHGLLGFDGAGHTVTPIYMWADTRSAPDAVLLREALDERAVHARTGCHLHSSYWPAKLRWLVRERPEAMARGARWGSFGEDLELNPFGEASTSVSMASATGLFDQQALRWDAEALAAAELDERGLVPLCDRRDARRGFRPQWAKRWPALRSRPWFAAGGDGAASNIGSGRSRPRRVALNVGTSAALPVAPTAPGRPPWGLWRYRVDRGLSLIGGAPPRGGDADEGWRGGVRPPPPEGGGAAPAPPPARPPGPPPLPPLP